MAIYVDAGRKRFHLDASNMSYIFEALPQGNLAHWYWGPKIRPDAGLDRRALLTPRAFSPNPVSNDERFSFDVAPQEYPTWGRGDYRSPAYQIRLSDGSAITDLAFREHRLLPGKPRLSGLPHLWIDNPLDADTLVIVLEDTLGGMTVELSYTVFSQLNALVRSATIHNHSQMPLTIERALSASVDFAHADWDWIRLTGAWGRERQVQRSALANGLSSLGSRRGASSHQANPFIALVDPKGDETTGRVYAMNLVYSGNFVAMAEVDQFDTTRMAIGIHPFQFQWRLEPGESFQTPEAVLVFSDAGLGQMSETFHHLYRDHLMPEPWRRRERPIVLNNWEATYFDFNQERLLDLADSAAALGVEVLVLDDGWFGARNDDRTSLGDWTVNLKKLPDGISGLSQKIHQRGLKFGLWVEPEMVSPQSDLYRRHPEWCLHVPNRSPSLGRHQLVLDLARPDVTDWIIAWMTELLKEGGIDYIKWDMNRHMTEAGSELLPPERQPEVQHRYMLGLYRVLDHLTRSFPEVLFEGCSGGGGRFDPGMLYYMPQTWTSDNSDAIERLCIQYGTSLAYPAIAMTAHVSAVPNHQAGRTTPLNTRGLVAMSANFGYELDFTQLSDAEKQAISQQITMYKQLRPLVQWGAFYRLIDPHETNAAGWMFVDDKRSRAFVVWVNRLAEVGAPVRWMCLRGLSPERDYDVFVQGAEGAWEFSCRRGGDGLMELGLNRQYGSDFGAKSWYLQWPSERS